MPTGGKDRNRSEPELDLHSFFPYRLALLADVVSHSMAQLYADRFDLTRQEWRILAILGGRRRMAGRDVGRQAALDKMQVSRALARLEERGLVTRTPDPDDRRNQLLAVTASGRQLYQKIIPLVRAREEYILSALTAEEAQAVDTIMDKIQARAEDLLRRG